MSTPLRTIVGLSGSLRRGSLNTMLLDAAGARLPEGFRFVRAEWREVPIYDGDLEAAGAPPAVEALKAEIAAADALLVASPEYNHSLPGGLKNAIDWLSRPPPDRARVFGGKVVGLIGLTPGPGGTRAAQTAWLPVFRALGLDVYAGHMVFGTHAGQAFGPDRRIVDDALDRALGGFVAGFADHVRRHARAG
jgi:NAD(P)H-dependent FMN reductase